METGRMVILLNLESLYESLYDALNQVTYGWMYFLFVIFVLSLAHRLPFFTFLFISLLFTSIPLFFLYCLGLCCVVLCCLVLYFVLLWFVYPPFPCFWSVECCPHPINDYLMHNNLMHETCTFIIMTGWLIQKTYDELGLWGCWGYSGSACVSHHWPGFVTCEKSVFQFDSTTDRRFSLRTSVFSCSNTRPMRGGPHWTSREDSPGSW